MKLPYLVRRVHLWLGLLLGIQVLIWMASGVVMSWFHITEVRGEHNAPANISIELAARSYANPGGVIAQVSGAYDVRLKHFLGRPAYVVSSADGEALFDAQTGEQLSPIREASARAVAKAAFVGDGEIDRVRMMTDPPPEYGKPGPVWRADFSDSLNTRLYISPDTGEVEARRNKIWRLYDFFWMLHIMDYDERENFNNPLIRAASATGLLFALSGAVLIVLSIRNKRLRLRDKTRSTREQARSQENSNSE